MIKTDVVIIGGSQAGLSMSHHLGRLGVPHLVLERGSPGERWRTERWSSLRLLTPNWQSQLSGLNRALSDPGGFMSARGFGDLLGQYAHHIGAPVHTGIEVKRLGRSSHGGFSIHTNQETYASRAVVVATGQCARPNIPGVAQALSSELVQLHSRDYRGAEQLPPGGVLVVGASATGVQLAGELRRSGRQVVLSVGPHTRMLRRYRGRDIMSWLEFCGITRDPRGREDNQHVPSLQLIGSDDHRDINLELLSRDGVQIVGSLGRANGDRVSFRGDLAHHMADSRQRLLRTLDRIDASIHALGWDSHVPAAHRPASLDVPPYVGERELEGSGISTVLWATGYRSHMPFLPSWARTRASREQPGREVEPLQSGGIGASPGLYFLGLNFMRHRYSSTIGGVQEDARYLSHVILEHFERRYARAS